MFHESWLMASVCCNSMLQSFIFLLKYLQRKVDLCTSQKSLLFVTIRIRHKNFHLYVQASHVKISNLCKGRHLRKDAAFLHFRLKESSKNMILSLNGNLQKLKKIWYFLSFLQIFVRKKFFFQYKMFKLF